MLPPEAQIWGVKRFGQLFPNLRAPLPPITPPQGPGIGTPPGASTGLMAGGQQDTGIIQIDAATLMQFLQAALATGAPVAATPDTGKDKRTFKVSNGVKTRMKRMFGLVESAGDECFPYWFQVIFAKHQNDVSPAYCRVF